MATLNTFVHVVERGNVDTVGRSGTFGPDDELPDWAIAAITNPKVWADPPDQVAGVRPRGNSSRDTWAGYASTYCGITVTSDMGRDEIIAAVDAATG